MSKVKEIVKALKKEHGDQLISDGGKPGNPPRLLTGVFPLDLASGGGLPRGKTTVLYGAESSGKTNVALKAIANAQREEPDKTAVFVDAEGGYDPDWASMMGVDNDKLVHCMPDYAEQAVDLIEAFLYAEDVSIVVLDSIAALVTANEIDSSASKMVVGGSGLVVGRLYRKSTLALNKARKDGRFPIFLAINQIRFKIGATHSDPEVMPGGQAFKYSSSLTIRLYGKDEVDKAIHAEVPCWKVCSGIVKKHKVPIAARNFEFRMAKVPIPSKKLKMGGMYDWATILSYMKNFELLVKGKTGWEFQGEVYKTQDDIRQRMLDDYDFDTTVRSGLIDLAMEYTVEK